jgi:wyosine [tRNA(Phe)-imidazoG37] synthetase (radical SAM superfamily)
MGFIRFFCSKNRMIDTLKVRIRKEDVHMLVFGPVPSRRLGRSLGINNIPPKHCSYSCLYCQVGSTTATEIQPRAFYSPEAIFDAVEEHLEKLKARKETVDYLTFVPDGEPTLDPGLGKSIELLRGLKIKIAIISNASLVWQNHVREILKMADWVSLKVDSVDALIWRRINRPCEGLDLDDILSGMLAFADEFKGTLVTETMLLDGINTADDSIERLTAFLQKLAPHKVYLAIPTRPTAESSVNAPSAETLNRIYQTVNRIMPNVELLTGYEGDGFASTGNFTEDILAITAVHPMRKDAVLKLLGKTGSDWSAVQQLLLLGKLREIDYQGSYFYLRAD